MPLYTKRWDDGIESDDGTRILITRYRPRGLKKEFESWTEWLKELAPSAELLAGFHGKHGNKISWDLYRRRYLTEMRSPDSKAKIAELAQRLKSGETITLLCSSACIKESRCHRSLLAELIQQELTRPATKKKRGRRKRDSLFPFSIFNLLFYIAHTEASSCTGNSTAFPFAAE